MVFIRFAVASLLAISVIACAATPQRNASGVTEEVKRQSRVNSLEAMRLERTDGETVVVFVGEAKPEYNIFRMQNPQRIVVDFVGCENKALPTFKDISDGLLTTIATNQFTDKNGQTVSRVLIAFEQKAMFSVGEGDNSLLLRIKHPEGYVYNESRPKDSKPKAEVAEATIADAEQSGSGSGDELTEREAASHKLEEVAEESTEENTEEAMPILEREAQTGMEGIAVSQTCEKDEIQDIVVYKGEISEAILNEVSFSASEDALALSLQTSKPLVEGSYSMFRLCSPNRFVVDLFGVKKAVRGVRLEGDGTFIKRIRLGEHNEKLRLVFDMAKMPERVGIADEEGALTIAMNAESALPVAVVKEEKAAIAAVESEPLEIAPETKANDANVKRLDFRQYPNESAIEISLEGQRPDYNLSETGDGVYTLELAGVQLPKKLEQSMDTSEFDSPVSMVSSFNAEEGDRVKVIVQTRYPAANAVEFDKDRLIWRFDADTARHESASIGDSGGISLTASGDTLIEYEASETAAAGQLRGQVAEPGSASLSDLKNQRISLELKNTDIIDVLRLISDISKLNIVASDDVRGRVTLRLLNVPWQTALDIILRANGLGKERQGNILRIAPLARLQKEQEVRLKQLEAAQSLEPMSVRLIPVSYGKAGAMVPKVKELLSDRGSVSFDQRTNVLIVEDIDEVLSKVEGLITKLDLQTPQVMIEAKIIEADVSSSQGFGIQWGGYFVMSEATGNPTGLNYPANFGLTGSQDSLGNPGIPNPTQPPNWVVNVPSTLNPAMGLGMTMGNVANTHNLSLRLTAAESAGKVKIISSPRISTIDNSEATIEQGVQIPITSVSTMGLPVSKMIQANLTLTVTPHITADGSIIMKINIQKQEPDFSRANANGDPAIVQKRAETEVLVRTGETTVIGGIYAKSESVSDSGVPVLMHIPVLGYLFKNHTVTSRKSELLIFVTPRIINRTQSSLVAD